MDIRLRTNAALVAVVDAVRACRIPGLCYEAAVAVDARTPCAGVAPAGLWHAALLTVVVASCASGFTRLCNEVFAALDEPPALPTGFAASLCEDATFWAVVVAVPTFGISRLCDQAAVAVDPCARSVVCKAKQPNKQCVWEEPPRGMGWVPHTSLS